MLLTRLDNPAAAAPRVTPSVLVSSDNERMVRRYVAALCHQPRDVDDLTQEVFVRALTRINSIHSPDAAPRYLRGVARKVVQEHFRSRTRSQRHVELTAEAVAGSVRTPAALCADRDALRALRDAIAALPIVSRRMLEMRYHDDRSAAQIAAALDIDHAAVRMSLMRIRQRLRRAIGPHL
ncbi:MAG: sigma-70 family RNA polymerase sigma factor [Planctomycetes bacterium]|nr:sigma-70 family RNA polymerase sigma factor [Planctomycetota bacterium]